MKINEEPAFQDRQDWQRWFYGLMQSSRVRRPPRRGLHAATVVQGDKDFCLREAVFAAAGLEKEQEERTGWLLSVFENGWYLHQRWQDVLKKAGVAVEVERTHVAELGALTLAYTPDALIEREGRLYVLEIKGYGPSLWEQVATGKAQDPVRSARRQGMLYAALLRREGIPVDGVVLLIEEKANQRIRCFEFPFAPEEVTPSVERLRQIERHMRRAAQDQEHFGRVDYNAACTSFESARAKVCPFRRLCFFRYRSTEMEREASAQAASEGDSNGDGT